MPKTERSGASGPDSGSSSSTPSPDPGPGCLLVISGPSGVGKSSVVDGVLARTGADFSVSVTTRPPREGEVDGEDYVFVDDVRFDELIAQRDLLEWAEYGGHRYGTPRTPMLGRLEAGGTVILDIENEGARQVKSTMSDARLIFIMPPSLEELERRLRARGDTNDTDIARRLAVAGQQIRDAEERYDDLVVNDDLETAISRVVSILEAPIPSGPGADAPAGRDGPRTRSSPP